MKYNLYEASKSLSRINLNLGQGMEELMSYWCRVVIAEREIPNRKLHRHSFFELHLCLEGVGKYSAGEREFTLSKNQYILLPPSYRHRIISEEDGFRKLVWGFKVKDEAVSQALSEACCQLRIMTAPDEVIASLDIILDNAYNRRFGYYNVIKGQLSNIYASLVRGLTELTDNGSFKKKPSLVIEEIKSYISDNLQLSPSTGDIALQFSKSPGTLDKMCRSECGMSVSGLKKQLQFEKIKELLAQTEYNLDTISDICGFADRYTMGKFFKKLEGVPPGEFRKSNRK